jgi:putative ABC transport system permease protein
VSDGYFSTMGIPILAGTPCDRRTDGILVNRTFVSTYFGGRDPVGHHLVINANSPDALKAAILGVVGDAREFGLNSEVKPTAYWCAPVLDPGRYYLVRTAGDPANLASAVRQRMHTVEPGRAVYDLAPLTAHLSEAFAEVRLRTLLLSLFAATALSLACVGLYGSMSYAVTTRRREIGVRMALGAGRKQIGLRIVARAMAVTAAGAAVGLLLSEWSARFISGMLYNVRANDPTSLSAAVAAMLLVALLASAVPALRATRIDPIETLREE